MKDLVIFLIGAGLGAGITYLVMRNKSDKKTVRTDEEFEEDIRRAKRARREEGILDSSKEDMVKYASELIKDIFGNDEDGAIDFLANELESFGANVSNHYGEEYEEVASDVNPTDDSDSGEIYPIQKILYDTNHSDYSKETIAYYDGDSTFVDTQTGMVVEDWKDHLGGDIFNWIEDHDFSVENLCVRNDAMETDYEIIRKDIAYSVESGESDDPDEYAPGDFADRR